MKTSSMLKPRTPKELSRLLQCGRVSKKKAPFVKGFVVTDLFDSNKSRLRKIRKINPRKKSNNHTSNGKQSEEKTAVDESSDSEETLTGTDEESENQNGIEEIHENENGGQELVDKENQSSDTDSDSAEELAKFSQFESASKSSGPVVFRRVEPKVFQIEFRKTHTLYFQGKVVATLLEGEVSVLGWPLVVGKVESIFSSRGASHLGMLGQKGAVLELKRTDTNLDSSLRKLHPIGLFSGQKEKIGGHKPATTARILAERSLDCKFLADDSAEKVVVVDHRWNGHLQQLLYCAKIDGFRAVMCGGKGLGKSTFMRMLINKILSQQEEKRVLVLDLDPGQSEFTAPGCLSLVEVNEPLLGPSFTHIKTPIRSLFLGEIDVTRCFSEYQKAAQDFIKHCSFLEEPVPLIVNTMGFNTGIGVDIMMQVIKQLLEIGPLNAVEMRSHDFRRNYPDGTFYFGPDCRHIPLQSMAENMSQNSVQAQWGMPPNVQREICVLSYLSPILHPPHFSFLQEPPYVIRLGYLVLGVVNEYVHPNLILRALVGNLVALCKVDNDHPKIKKAKNGNSLSSPRVICKPPALPCFGYGVVCGIDLPAGQLYLQTPEAKSNLHEVNCLLMGAVQLPPVLRMTGARGSVPFVSTGEISETSAPVRVKYRPISSLVEKRS